ncbi:hypothetical protein HN385_04260 [archaeon]|jgi:hypothetical protein|nr:hypothetical protein [archaeon]MBT3450456.1 hypothetical protein [archaeon]MBT6868987.1 hypothetical protein [archaeon]MBT7193253.1 hypothetical protein [archaeon]MBT7380108.1 hypothetical protein [archaeon]
MNLKYFSIILLITSIFFVSSVLADVTVSDDDLIFEVDYSELEDNDDEIIITHSINFENNGSSMESVTLTLFAEDNDYEVSFVDTNDDNFDLESGSSKTVELEIIKQVEGADQGSDENVVSILIETTSGQSEEILLDADILMMFELKSIDFYVNSYSIETMDEDDSDDDDKDLEIQPNDFVELGFEIENLFDSNFDEGDLDFTVTITLEDNDFGEDVDDDIDFTIDADDSIDVDDDEYFIGFEVPSFAEPNEEYILNILVEAEDGNNVAYSVEWEAQLELDREDDDLRIEEVTSNNDDVSCYRSIRLTIDVLNYGTDSQKYGILTINNNELSIGLEQEFEIGEGLDESGNSITLQETFEISSDVGAGTYELDIDVYYNNDDFSDTETFEIIITDCDTGDSDEDGTSTGTEEEISTEDNDTGSSDEDGGTTTVTNNEDEEESGNSVTSDDEFSPVNTVEESYLKDQYVFAAVIVGSVLILAIFVMIITMIATRK